MTALWVFLICVALSAPTIVTSGQLSSVKEATKRHKSRLNMVYELTDRVNKLEQENAALKAEVKSRRCESGSQPLNPHNKPQKTIRGAVVREGSVHVMFSRPFDTKPWVSVSLSVLDADKNKNLRVNTFARNVTVSGFDVAAWEWSDTHLYNVKVSWIACSF